MIDLSIILVNYNTKQLTLSALASIYNSTKNISFEVIVVDNNSSDGSVHEIVSKFPGVHVIVNDENLGFGAANNIGVRQAKGDYCLFLNTDTILLNEAIEILFHQVKNTDFDVVCGNLYDENHHPATSYSKQFPGLLFELKSFFLNVNDKFSFLNNTHNYSNKSIRIKGSLSGADFMMSRELFNRVGGFDEDFFLYYEETDLFYRMHLLGYRFGSVPNAKILHLEGASERVRRTTLERTFRSRNIFFAKHYTKFYKKLCDLLFLATCQSRITIFGLIKRDISRENWIEIKSVFKEFN